MKSYNAFELVIPIMARLVWILGPRHSAQRRAFTAARSFARIDAAIRGPRDRRKIPVEAIIMNAMICNFCLFDKAFTLATRMTGLDLQHAAHREGRGALIATVHTKLALAAHGAICIDGKRPLFVGFGDGDLRKWSWGAVERIERLPPDTPGLFTSIDRALASGRTVISFVDYARNGNDRAHISPNLFAWAQARAIPVLPMLATLENNGIIRLELGEALPGSSQDSAHQTDAFVNFITARWPRDYVVMRPRNAISSADPKRATTIA